MEYQEQSASNKELHKFPKNLFNEEGSRFRYKFCHSPIRHVKRLMSSGLLLKGFALAFGLWNPRRRWCAIFALIFLLADVYIPIPTTIYVFLCPTLRVQSTLASSFCSNKSALNYIRSKDVKGYHMKEVFLEYAVLDVSKLLSHLTSFWSVWMISKKTTCLKQENTLTLVNPSGWIKLNCVLLFSWCALISCTVWVVFGISSYAPGFLVFYVAHFVSLWTSLLTCWLFCTLISSLETLVTRCTHDIMTSEHLDDVIKKHQKLCKIIFGTSNAFKLWFMVHWILYTITCGVWVSNSVSYFTWTFQSWSIIYYTIVAFLTYFYIFIYPCYRAAALTVKCQQMLANFNLMSEEDWHDNHPFRKRSQLHLFLQYASYADCGYKVGRYTFGSMAVLFSTLLAIVGIGLKIL